MADLVRRGGAVPSAPDVSIIIPILDRIDRLLPCLHSLSGLPFAPLHEVVVVANGTTESTLAALPEPERLVVVPSPVNLGFGGGCNWGARFARGRHLVLLNDDTEVERDWLAALVEVADSDPRIGAAGSRLLDPDGTLQEAGSVLWSDGGTYQVGRGLAAGSHDYDRIRDVDYCSACGLLIRRAAWEAVGGFDEIYFPAYHEDVDLCLSLRSRGWRVVYAPKATLRHHRGGSMDQDLRTWVAELTGRRFVAKWGEALHDFEPHPDAASWDRAVATAITRAEKRPLPPLRPAEAAPRARPVPTEAEALQVQARARRAAERVREEVRKVRGEVLHELRRQRSLTERLRRLSRRLHLPHWAVGWVSRRLGGG